MKKTYLIALIVLIAALATFGIAAANNSKTVYTTGLSDETGTGSPAHGHAVTVFADDGSKMAYKLVANGINNTTMAHIHVAPTPGANGPIVLWLYPDAPPLLLIPGVFNGLLGGNTVTSADLTGAAGITSLAQLMAAIEEGRAYVNVHTVAFPGGEMRGTLHR
jgi:hypothetical protein